MRLAYSDGEYVYRKGEKADRIYLIEKGAVALHNGDDGYDVDQGNAIGELEVLTGKSYQHDAMAAGNVTLHAIDKNKLNESLNDIPSELKVIFNRLVSEFEQKQPSLPAKKSDKNESTVIEYIRPEEFDFGNIEPLIRDETINDILINGTDSVYVEYSNGKLERTDIRFDRDEEIIELAQRIVKAVGRELDPNRPMVDARLLDGSRVNVVSPPLSVDGTTISIRKFSHKTITLDKMVEWGNVSEQLGEFLKICGKCRLNTVISGGTGSGKTTMLNAISQYIDDEERIVTIEDAAELRLKQPHVVRLETKPLMPGMEKRDQVNMYDLLRNALRMRPDRIIVGEVRGPEAFDMMQAMNTGHEGSLTTIHANHPRDALSRLENMVGMANLGLPINSIRKQISSAIQLVIQVSRMKDGLRRIRFVSEIVGMEGDMITMQDLFTYEYDGENEDGTLKGNFKWTGIMPRFLRRIAYYNEIEHLEKALGVQLPKF